MKKLFVFCFSLLLVFISCDNKTTKKIENSATANLIKIGFYPATDGQPAETILNLKEKYLVFILLRLITTKFHRLRKPVG